MRVYYKVSRDELELIEAIADTSAELAKLCGVRQTTVLQQVRRWEKGSKASQYRRLELTEQEAEV